MDQASSSSKHHQTTSHNSTSASSAAAAEKTRQAKASRSNRSKKPPRPSPYHHQTTKLTHSNNTTDYHNNNNNNSACVIKAYSGQPYYTTGLLSAAGYSQGVEINRAASIDRTDAVYERHSHCAESLPRYGYEYSYPDDTGSAMQYSQLRGMTPNHFAYFGYFGSSVIRPASSPSPAIIPAPDQSSESSPAGFRIHAPLNLYSNYSSQNYSGYSSSSAYVGGLTAHSDSGINSSSSPSSPPSYVTESGTPCSSRGYPVQLLEAASQSIADPVASTESAPSSTDSMQKSAGLLSSCARQGQQQVDISTQIVDDHSSLQSPFVSACLASAGGSNETWQDKYSDSPMTTDLLTTGSGSVIVRRRLTADADALKHQNGGANNSAVTVTPPQHAAPDFDWTDGGYETGTALSTSVLKSSSNGGDICWRDDSFYLLTKGGHVTHPSMRVASSSTSSSAGKSASFSCDVTARFSEAISDETDKTTDSGNFLLATGNQVPSGYTSVIVDMPTTVNYAG